MEQILKNSALFINVLGMSRTSSVQLWDADELKKAFKWAGYFEQVYSKLEKKDKQRHILDKELWNQSCSENTQLGTSILRFEDLKHAKQILSRNLLQNVWCTPEIYTETIKLSYTLPEIHSDNKLFLNEITQMRKICKVSKMLKAVGSEVVKASAPQTPSKKEENEINVSSFVIENVRISNKDESVPTDFEEMFCYRVQARLLKDYMLKCLGSAYSDDQLISRLDTILCNKIKHVQLLSFMCRDIDESDAKIISLIIKLTKEKLIPRWKSDHDSFMAVPAFAVVDIAVLSCDIFKEYLRLLYSCCQKYDRKNSSEELYLISRMIKTPETECKTFQKLEFHFEEICKRKERCNEFFLKIKDDIIMPSDGSRNDQLFYRFTWDKLSNKYFSFLF